MSKLICVALVSIAIVGCKGSANSDMVIDQCLRIQLAQQCVKDLPASPVETKYNDWDEVINQCDENSMRQSVRLRKYVKPECAR